MSISCEIGEYHKSSKINNRHWFKKWIGAVRQQAIIWAYDPDLCHHMASLVQNGLTYEGQNNMVTIL